MEVPQEVESAFSKAKIGIMSQHNSVFTTTILFSLKHTWSDKIPSMMTNGIDLQINPEYFMGLDPKVRITALAKISWHVALNHMQRGQGLDYQHERFAKAADYVTTELLEKGGYTIPSADSKWLRDSKYDNQAAEQVYQQLPEEPPKPPEQGNGGWSPQFEPNTSGTKEEQQRIQNKVEDTIVKAATQSKLGGDKPGTIPGDIEKMLEALLNPKLPWNIILQNFMNDFAKDDYSYQKPNRRFLPDYYLPSQFGEALDEVCVAVDTSGSVSNAEFAAFLSEINDIKETLNPKNTKIIDFDSRINTVVNLGEDDSVTEVKFKGGGGTNLEPVFEHYAEGTKPTVLIVFSDLYCRQIQEDPGYPVIWICVNNTGAEVKFGEVIHYDTREIIASQYN
jgi:predicted metal-dependent peptidase